MRCWLSRGRIVTRGPELRLCERCPWLFGVSPKHWLLFNTEPGASRSVIRSINTTIFSVFPDQHQARIRSTYSLTRYNTKAGSTASRPTCAVYIARHPSADGRVKHLCSPPPPGKMKYFIIRPTPTVPIVSATLTQNVTDGHASRLLETHSRPVEHASRPKVIARPGCAPGVGLGLGASEQGLSRWESRR